MRPGNEVMGEVEAHYPCTRPGNKATAEVVLKKVYQCVLQVRKAQLLKLLQEEHQQYEAELQGMGLAFHRDRI